ncbi:hypothetical protein A8926_2864 [Saccharopolyspora spinosa]|uniref:Uncharacterized protein n=1 Tax=Saccharopolyspora spinosa TaxID=60894 RepID=A0A2N3XWY8_SACSN|nr:hypothetical protein A8926_2864 [Saccharopolyspora spinosa]
MGLVALLVKRSEPVGYDADAVEAEWTQETAAAR